MRTVSGAKLSVTSGVFIANGNVKRTSNGAYIIKGMVRDLFSCTKKATTGVYMVKGRLKKLDMTKKSASSGEHQSWGLEDTHHTVTSTGGTDPYGQGYTSHGYKIYSHHQGHDHGSHSFSNGMEHKSYEHHSGNGMKHFSWKKHHSSSKKSTSNWKKHFSSKKSATHSFHMKKFW